MAAALTAAAAAAALLPLPVAIAPHARPPRTDSPLPRGDAVPAGCEWAHVEGAHGSTGLRLLGYGVPLRQCAAAAAAPDSGCASGTGSGGSSGGSSGAQLFSDGDGCWCRPQEGEGTEACATCAVYERLCCEWAVEKENAFCSAWLRADIGSRMTFSDCAAAVRSDDRCRHPDTQMYTDGNACHCVLKSHECDFAPGNGRNNTVYKRVCTPGNIYSVPTGEAPPAQNASSTLPRGKGQRPGMLVGLGAICVVISAAVAVVVLVAMRGPPAGGEPPAPGMSPRGNVKSPHRTRTVFGGRSREPKVNNMFILQPPSGNCSPRYGHDVYGSASAQNLAPLMRHMSPHSPVGAGRMRSGASNMSRASVQHRRGQRATQPLAVAEPSMIESPFSVAINNQAEKCSIHQVNSVETQLLLAASGPGEPAKMTIEGQGQTQWTELTPALKSPQDEGTVASRSESKTGSTTLPTHTSQRPPELPPELPRGESMRPPPPANGGSVPAGRGAKPGPRGTVAADSPEQARTASVGKRDGSAGRPTADVVSEVPVQIVDVRSATVETAEGNAHLGAGESDADLSGLAAEAGRKDSVISVVELDASIATPPPGAGRALLLDNKLDPAIRANSSPPPPGRTRRLRSRPRGGSRRKMGSLRDDDDFPRGRAAARGRAHKDDPACASNPAARAATYSADLAKRRQQQEWDRLAVSMPMEAPLQGWRCQLAIEARELVLRIQDTSGQPFWDEPRRSVQKVKWFTETRHVHLMCDPEEDWRFTVCEDGVDFSALLPQLRKLIQATARAQRPSGRHQPQPAAGRLQVAARDSAPSAPRDSTPADEHQPLLPQAKTGDWGACDAAAAPDAGAASADAPPSDGTLDVPGLERVLLGEEYSTDEWASWLKPAGVLIAAAVVMTVLLTTGAFTAASLPTSHLIVLFWVAPALSLGVAACAARPVRRVQAGGSLSRQSTARSCAAAPAPAQAADAVRRTSLASLGGFPEGTWVEAHGLRGDTVLNGARGQVVGLQLPEDESDEYEAEAGRGDGGGHAPGTTWSMGQATPRPTEEEAVVEFFLGDGTITVGIRAANLRRVTSAPMEHLPAPAADAAPAEPAGRGGDAAPDAEPAGGGGAAMWCSQWTVEFPILNSRAGGCLFLACAGVPLFIDLVGLMASLGACITEEGCTDLAGRNPAVSAGVQWPPERASARMLTPSFLQ